MLSDIGMKMGLELRPGFVTAANNKVFTHPRVIEFFQAFCDSFEMVHDFMFDMTLGVTGIVPGKTVAPTAARHWRFKILALADVTLRSPEQACSLPIHHRHTGLGHSVQHRGQRTQMEALIHE